jgi:hypothetical protein
VLFAFDATVNQCPIVVPPVLYVNNENFIEDKTIQSFLAQAPMLETFHYSYYDTYDNQKRVIETALATRPTVRVYFTKTDKYAWVDKDWWNNYGTLIDGGIKCKSHVVIDRGSTDEDEEDGFGEGSEEECEEDFHDEAFRSDDWEP